ncbi:hypothetical protein ACFOKI_02900 [Sphingomonas qilianensis]|uniref:Uncharacterized protein n=1 Tax=Sphingomonas qilianensis TaxID=1736690 RepID=A0ABU9XVJ2_9SPHN
MFKTPSLEEGRRFITLIASSSQDQCREMGELMTSLASSPRDHHWRMQMQKALDNYPEAPVSSIASAIEDGRARVKADNDELWATGWHPIQMRAKLVELGYNGAADGDMIAAPTASIEAPQDSEAVPD